MATDGTPVHDDAEEQFAHRLALARAGDPRGFDALVGWLERPLVGFLRARGSDDAEALANEVLVRAFTRIDTFSGNAVQFRAWVFRIARNALIDERRHRARRVDTVPTDPQDLPDTAAPTTDVIDDVHARERVEALLAVLTDDQREIVLLRVVAGLSVDETAEVVGRRPGAVRSMQNRALNRMRRALSTKAVTR